MIQPLTIPGLFITGTGHSVGKTVIAGAIADWFVRQGRSVAVCKLAATGCQRRREGLVSVDAEFLAVCARSKHPLDLIAPQRWAEPLAPAIAAERAQRPLDWFVINNSIRLMSRGSDVMIVEGAGGLLEPLDAKNTVLDAARGLDVPSVVVATAGRGTINDTLLTVNALRHSEVKLAGVVVNRYPTDMVPAAEETSPRAIERWGRVPVLCIVPEEPLLAGPMRLPAGIVSAINQVDWDSLARHR